MYSILYTAGFIYSFSKWTAQCSPKHWLSDGFMSPSRGKALQGGGTTIAGHGYQVKIKPGRLWELRKIWMGKRKSMEEAWWWQILQHFWYLDFIQKIQLDTNPVWRMYNLCLFSFVGCQGSLIFYFSRGSEDQHIVLDMESESEDGHTSRGGVRWYFQRHAC